FDTRPDLDHAGAELVTEELDGRFGFEPSFDAVKCQSRDSLGELGFRHARLHTNRLDQHLARAAAGLGDVVEPHVAKAVKAPGLHRAGLRLDFCRLWQSAGTSPRLAPADQTTSAT